MIPNVLYPSLLKVCLQQIIRKYNFPHDQKGVISIKSGVTKSASFMWQILTPLLSDPFSTHFRYSALTPQNWLCRKNFSEEYRRNLAICLGLSLSPSIFQWASTFYITQKATVRLCTAQHLNQNIFYKSYLITKIWKKTACRYPGNTPIDLKESIIKFFNT